MEVPEIELIIYKTGIIGQARRTSTPILIWQNDSIQLKETSNYKVVMLVTLRPPGVNIIQMEFMKRIPYLL